MGGFQRLSQAHGVPISNHTSMSGAPEQSQNGRNVNMMMNVPLSLNFRNNNMQRMNLMRAPLQVSTLRAANHPASYHTMPMTSMPRAGQIWTPRQPHPPNFGMNENVVMYQPTLLAPVGPESSTRPFQVSDLNDNVSQSSIPCTQSEINNNDVLGRPYLDPQAKEFRPTSGSVQLSAAIPEFKPNPLVHNTLPPSKPQQTSVLEQKVKSVIPSCPQNPNVLKPLSSSTIKKALEVKSSRMKRLSSVKTVCDTVSTESQTTLTGTEMEEKLCDKCKAVLMGGTARDVVPIFLKMKDISMQHKLKYLACKAAVFVRESRTILTQPLEFKFKLLSRLNKMCSYFGAESSESTSWQDDIACTIAFNLLTEEPELSSTKKSASFLQQLKEEMESHMEIARDILDAQKNSDENRKTEIAGELDGVVPKPVIGSENLFSPKHGSVSVVTLPGERNVNGNDLVIDVTSDNRCLTSNYAMPATSNSSAVSFHLDPTPSANNNAFYSNLHLGSANSIALDSNLHFGSSNSIALDSNLHLGSANSIALDSNFQMGSSGFGGIGFNSNVDVTANSPDNSMNNGSMVSQGLLQMQQNYLQMLTCMNSVNQPALSPSMNATSTELGSDKFVSEISQNLCEFKLDSYPPSLASPSLSIEDDVSVAMSKSSQERVRHLSSSTSNSDSDRNVKKKSHHSQDSPTGVKKLPPPLDFRAHKSAKNSNPSHASSVIDKPVSDIDSHLNALYKSFISQSVDDSTTSQMTTNKAQSSSIIDSDENVTTSSSEIKPLRRLTPLQRKLLKRNEGSTQGEVKEKISMLQNLPKTVESEELRLLTSYNTAYVAHGEVTHRNLGKEVGDWNSFSEHSGDACSKCTEFSALSDSDYKQSVKDLEDVAITEDLGKEKPLWNPFITNPRHDTELGAIGRDLCQALTSHFNSQGRENDLSSPESFPQSEKDEYEENYSGIIISGSSEENDFISDVCQPVTAAANTEVTPMSEATSALNLLQNDIEPAEEFSSMSLPSEPNRTPAICHAHVHSSPDTASSLAEHISSVDVQDCNNPLSYSSVVKQKLATTSAETKITEDITAYVEFESSFSGESYPSLNRPTHSAEQLPVLISETEKIHQSDTPITSNDTATGGRTWSSLFRSSSQGSNKTVTVSKEEEKTDEESKSFVDWWDRTGVERGCDVTSYNVKGPQKFGNYGLDDFSCTPPSLKHKEKENNPDDKKEETSKAKQDSSKDEPAFETRWKVVNKKSKKNGFCPALEKFRMEEYYNDLCLSITEKYPGIAVSAAKDVLETVFVETDGMFGLDKNHIIAEVKMALTEMCPNKCVDSLK